MTEKPLALCEEITATLATLGTEAAELLECFAELDGVARESLRDPYCDGTLGWRSPTEEARAGLRFFLLDELHSLLGLPAPRREIYFIAGRRKCTGPGEGILSERVAPCIEKLRARIAKTRAAQGAATEEVKGKPL